MTGGARHEVVAGVLVRDGRVLLCHRCAGRQWYPDVWDVPGGHVEAGESPHDALVRELREELGVVLVGEPGPVVIEVAEADLHLTAWLVTAWEGEVENCQPDEHDDLGWFGPEELDGLALPDPRYPELLRAALS